MRVTALRTPIAHVVGPGKLKIVNGRLAFAGRDRPPVRLDLEALEFVLCYGDVGVTDDAITFLFQNSVHVSWLTPMGNVCRGRMVSADASAASLRLRQYRALNQPEVCLRVACHWVEAKIDSMIALARHYQRHSNVAATEALMKIQHYRESCSRVTTLDQLRGLEGVASQEWFRVFATQLNPPWTFTRRARRPPPDPVNAILSLGYTWVLTRTAGRCEALGLELYLGALHSFHPGRPSLACDVMEPLRAPAVDRWVLRLLNEGGLRPQDFTSEDGIRLQPRVFGPTLQSWEKHWQSEGLDEMLDGQLRWLLDTFRTLIPDEAMVSPDS